MFGAPMGSSGSGMNGLFYDIDMPTQEFSRFYYNAETAKLSDKFVIATVPLTIVYPDGMTIDESDCLWVALWNGGSVISVDPKSGMVKIEFPIPARNVNSIAFGSAEFNKLYVATANIGLSAIERLKPQLAEPLFRVRLPYRGVPTKRYKTDLRVI